MGLEWIISEIPFRGLKYIGFRAIFTCKCLSQTFDVWVQGKIENTVKNKQELVALF